MLIKTQSDGHSHLSASQATPREAYLNRRALLAALAAAGSAPWAARRAFAEGRQGAGRALASVAAPASLGLAPEKPTSFKDASGYNNFYEFGTDKADPARVAAAMPTSPWSVSVEGLAARPRSFSLDELLALAPLEERLYRLRCVEGWSMAIPWIGYSLSALLKKVEPTGSAKFVEFVSLADPKSMPGLSGGSLAWPYAEALRIDEAMHPLAMLVFGMYGSVLPNQNGAPVRLATPWKYGFKSAKSIVKIRLVEKMPATAWNKAAANEYGFYSNVNPNVDHPRWSQATERRIGEDGLFSKKRKTLMFNGYEAQVGQLYAGMDLKKNF